MPPWVQEGGYRGVGRAPEGPGHPRQRSRRRCRRRPTTWENLLLAAGAEGHAARRLQEPSAQAADRQDARRGGRNAAATSARGHGDRPGHRGRQPGAGTVYFLMSEENVEAADRAALGELRLGRRVAWRPKACSCNRARTRAPTATSPACSASTCATRRSSTLEEAIRRLTVAAGREPRASPIAAS